MPPSTVPPIAATPTARRTEIAERSARWDRPANSDRRRRLNLAVVRSVHVRRVAEEDFGRLHERFGTASDAGGSSSRRLALSRPSRSQARLRRSARRRPGRRCRRRAPVAVRIEHELGRDPSVRSSVIARPDAPHGNLATATFRPCFSACVSVRPHHAISGSVKTTAGIARGSNATFVAGNHLDGDAPFVRRLVRQHRLADDVADREDRRLAPSGAARRRR